MLSPAHITVAKRLEQGDQVMIDNRTGRILKELWQRGFPVEVSGKTARTPHHQRPTVTLLTSGNVWPAPTDKHG